MAKWSRRWEFKDEEFIKCLTCNRSFPTKYKTCKKCGNTIPPKHVPESTEDLKAFAPIDKDVLQTIEERLEDLKVRIGTLDMRMQTMETLMGKQYDEWDPMLKALIERK